MQTDDAVAALYKQLLVVVDVEVARSISMLRAQANVLLSRASRSKMSRQWAVQVITIIQSRSNEKGSFMHSRDWNRKESLRFSKP